MNRNDLRGVFPQTPEHFIRRMDSVLEEIERMNYRKKRNSGKTLLIAATLILLLAGSAVAIGRYVGVFDFMKRAVEPIVPLEGAEELLESGLASAAHEFGSVEITEGIYSGRSCKVTVKVSNAQGYTHFYPELKFLNAQTPAAGAIDMVELDDGTTEYMLESMLDKDTPQVLDCEVTVPVFKDGEPQKGIKLMFSLSHAKEATAKLIPQNEGERWRIISGNLTRNEFSMVFDVEFEYTAEAGEDMGVDIRAFDENGEQYAMGDSSYGDRGLPLPGEMMVCRQIQEIQSTDGMPARITFRPKVIGEDKWLDEIVCVIE